MTPLERILAPYEKSLSELLGEPVKFNTSHLEYGSTKDKEGLTAALFNAASRRVANFSLTQLPGCCGVLVSHGAFVAYNYQRRGIGKQLAALRVELGKHFGYGVLLCTDLLDNEPQRRILSKLGWRDLHVFKNPRTNHLVAISLKEL